MSDTLPPSRPFSDRETAAVTATERGRKSGAAAAPAAGAAQLPTHVGPYEVLEKLGEGGMGKVYLCLDPQLRRRVAVKVLHDRYAQDPRYKARFLREAQTLASLSHSAVAQVYSVESSDNGLAIVMEHVEGYSLDRRIEERGAVAVAEAIALMRQAADGLRAAHARGIIHRDVKPSNLLVDGRAQAKIVDFGLAKDLESKSSITDDGIVLGTPQYISPEQGRGKPVDHRSDIYSLGATFYHLVAGRPPFDDDSQVAVIVAHVEKDPPPPHAVKADVPRNVSRVIGAMMAKRPEDRYPTYEQLISDLDRVAAGREPTHALERPGRFRMERSGPIARLRERLRSLLAARPSAGRFVAWAAIASVLVTAGAIAFVKAQEAFRPAREIPSHLAGWHVRRNDGGDVLLLDFARPPPGAEEKLRRIFVGPPGDEFRAPSLADGTLLWDSGSAAFGLSSVFESIEELRVHVQSHGGRFDFAVGIIDPLGEFRRSLHIALRPSEENPSPVVAMENGEIVRDIRWVKRPIPRLIPPYVLSASFVRRSSEESSTELAIEVFKESEARKVYDATVHLPGRNWSSGLVVFACRSPRHPFNIALSKIVVTGACSGELAQELPWRD